MLVRQATEKDLEKINALYKHYDFPLNLDHAFSPVLAENGDIRGFGWLEFIVEATILLDLDGPQRYKFEALRDLIDYGCQAAKRAGFDQLHAFPKDWKFMDILIKHYGFKPTNCCVRNL